MSEKVKEETSEFEKNWQNLFTSTITPFFNRVDTFPEKSLKKQSIPQSEFSFGYQIIFSLCSRKSSVNYSKLFYEGHTKIIKEHCELVIAKKLKEESKKDLLNFIMQWNECWRKFCWISKGLCRIFQYIERYFVENSCDVERLEEKSLRIYANSVVKEFGEVLRDCVITFFERERKKGKTIFRGAIKRAALVLVIIDSFSKTKIYRKMIERPLIRISKKFYRECGEKLVSQRIGFSEFLERADILYENEKKRAREILENASARLLMEELTFEMSKAHFEAYVHGKEKIILKMFSNDDIKALSKTLELYTRHSRFKKGIVSISQSFCKYIRLNLLKIMANEGNKRAKIEIQNGTINIIKQIEKINLAIKARNKARKIVFDFFGKEKAMEKVIKRTINTFLNSDGDFAPSFAHFINSLFVLKENDPITEKAKRNSFPLMEVADLHEFLKEKSLFWRILSVLLLQGLLNRNLFTRKIEGAFARKLDSNCGTGISYQLEAIKSDIIESQKMSFEWKESYGESLLSVKIIRGNFWPEAFSFDCKLPLHLSIECCRFKSYYKSREPKRNLIWRYDQGRAEIKIRFSEVNIKSLSVTTIQMLVLLMFNGEKDFILEEEMQRFTKIPHKLLKFHLKYLCSEENPVLIKKDPKELRGKECLFLNPKYGLQKDVEVLPGMQVREKIPPFYSEEFNLFAGENDGYKFSDLGKPTDLMVSESDEENSLEIWDGGIEEDEFSSTNLSYRKTYRNIEPFGSFLQQNSESRGEFIKQEAIDTVIVRVLKNEESLSETDLYLAVRGSLKNAYDTYVTRADLKERIEELCELEYLKVDERQGRVFYVP